MAEKLEKNNAASQKGDGSQSRTGSGSSKYSTSQRIVALIGVAALILLYIVTLAAAFFDRTAAAGLFRMCLFATVAVPILIWVYTWMYGKLTGKHTFTESDTSHRQNGQ